MILTLVYEFMIPDMYKLCGLYGGGQFIPSSDRDRARAVAYPANNWRSSESGTRRFLLPSSSSLSFSLSRLLVLSQLSSVLPLQKLLCGEKSDDGQIVFFALRLPSSS